MTLRDLLKKKNEIDHHDQQAGPGKSWDEKRQAPTPQQQMPHHNPPEFTFMRTTTSQQEMIEPPSFPGDRRTPPQQGGYGPSPPSSGGQESGKKRRSLFRKHSREVSGNSAPPVYDPNGPPKSSGDGSPPQNPRKNTERKLSARFSQMRMSRSLSRESVSSNLPDNLDPAPAPLPAPRSPEAAKKRPVSASDGHAAPVYDSSAALETAWETRATQLVLSSLPHHTSNRPVSRPRTDAQQADDEAALQNAIRLHESGDLPASTALFGRLADPAGANSALSQVLYGLALRHGWGIDVDAAAALRYLSLAAGNAGAIESHELEAQRQQQQRQEKQGGRNGSVAGQVIARATGGPAKGELVLAVFELGNCYRHGWGTAKDPKAAREYYEVAANLGDVDAMEEASWCCLTGFGGPKDKGRAARYLRLAEGRGRTQVGNSWIWKEKYDPPPAAS